MSRFYLFPLATLAALLLAPAAHAQLLTLNSGDNVTVSGAGTVGVIGGSPVANAVSNYTTSQSLVVLANFDSAFTLAAGGIINDTSVTGSSYGISANGSGPINITGGTISVGQYGYGIDILSSSPVTVSGGTIAADASNGFGLFNGGRGAVNITGGTFTGASALAVTSSSVITVTGGNFNVTGDAFYTYNGGTINLFSLGNSPFLVDGVPMNNTAVPRQSIYSNHVTTITGTLLNGETLNTRLQNFATINLNVGPVPAPEPSAFVALCVGALGLGVLTVKARRRAA